MITAGTDRSRSRKTSAISHCMSHHGPSGSTLVREIIGAKLLSDNRKLCVPSHQLSDWCGKSFPPIFCLSNPNMPTSFLLSSKAKYCKPVRYHPSPAKASGKIATDFNGAGFEPWTATVPGVVQFVPQILLLSFSDAHVQGLFKVGVTDVFALAATPAGFLSRLWYGNEMFLAQSGLASLHTYALASAYSKCEVGS